MTVNDGSLQGLFLQDVPPAPPGIGGGGGGGGGGGAGMLPNGCGRVSSSVVP